MSSIRFYGLGGLGLNLVSQLARFEDKQNEGFADISICYADTSKSNLRGKEEGIDYREDQLYIFDGIDGSGKSRGQNLGVMSESHKDFLHKFKPADLNVVVHSASGGSGSVLSNLVVTELLKRGHLVISIIVGTTSSRIETENTKKTLLSYEKAAIGTKRPVVAFYRENTKTAPRAKIDNEVVTFMILLCVLFSSQNRELDKADLENFINYHQVTDFPVRLSYLDFWSKDISLEKGQSLISVATICDDETTPELNTLVEYQAVGYLQEKNKDILNVQLPVHAGIISGFFNSKLIELDVKLGTFHEARGVVVSKAIVNEDDVSDGNFIMI